MITIKKYSNRRLYDTSKSSYITLDDLATMIRQGESIKVIDAKSGTDLTQSVLAQIILESRGASKLLPTSLLLQLIRMEDDSLSDFFTQHLSWSLGVYLKMRAGAEKMGPFNPMNNPFTQMMSNFYNSWPGMGGNQQPPQNFPYEPEPMIEPEPEPEPAKEDEITNLKAQMEELKNLILLQAQQNNDSKK